VVEATVQEIRVQRRTVLGDEHVAGDLPALPRRALLRPLPAPMLAQQAHRVPVQRDQPAARRRLRRPDRDQMTVGDALLLDHRHPSSEVDVGPTQSGGFTAAQATQGDQPPHHREAIVSRRGRGR
jgi:hypothetical protein